MFTRRSVQLGGPGPRISHPSCFLLPLRSVCLQMAASYGPRSRCKQSIFPPVFSDQNYNICFTNSIRSGLLTPSVTKSRISANWTVQNCRSEAWLLITSSALLLSPDLPELPHLHSDHITVLNMMFTLKFTGQSSHVTGRVSIVHPWDKLISFQSLYSD